MIERYKASQFLKENKNYDEEDLTQIFKDAKKIIKQYIYAKNVVMI